jgi:hypothetical protein
MARVFATLGGYTTLIAAHRGPPASAASIVEIVFFIPPSHSVQNYLMIIESDGFSTMVGVVIVGDNMERKSMSYYRKWALLDNSTSWVEPRHSGLAESPLR